MKYYIHNSTKVIIGCLLLFMAACSEKSLCPDENHPHAVDLGLPNGTKWACCNVGAPSPDGTGGFYSWGETEIKSNYDDNNYKHGELSNRIPQRMGNIAGSEYDAALVNMGSTWQMPSSEQWHELIDYCEWEWVTYKGHQGWRITGPNGNRIFIPAGGMKGGEQWIDKDDRFGYYWASDCDPNNFPNPNSFFTNGGCHEVRETISYQSYGFTIRAIANTEN